MHFPLLKKNYGLIILDDMFPNLLLGFKVAEYNYYLEHFKSSLVLSDDPDYNNTLKDYLHLYPENSERIVPYAEHNKFSAKLYYSVFLNTIWRFFPLIQKQNKPFIFTLYPGGGFQLDNVVTNGKLKLLCSSKLLRKVFVTQKITKEYLLKKNFLTEEKIELIYGSVSPTNFFKDNFKSKKFYKKTKNTFDVCFVAKRYMEKGLDKGFDIFIDVAKKICRQTKDINFHVIGGFSETEINVSEIKNRIKFYEHRLKEFNVKFYADMDIILAPNRPFTLLPGAFDGMPSGTCKEAGACEVAIFASDELNQAMYFKNGVDIVLIRPDADAYTKQVLHYYKNSDSLYRLAKKGRQQILKIFDIDYQMGKRIEIIKNYL
jgi:glycosyltransferase involved in cell wall biosynthesis